MFIVYLETNWLVSYVLPHHPWRADARSLLDAAERGECSLRIPVAALLEAKHVVERETEEHTRAVKAVSDSLVAAARNLQRPDLADVARAVVAVEASYRLADPRRELDALIALCQGFSISHPREEQAAMDTLLPYVGLRGGDVADFQILAAILADRDLDRAPQAAVLSTNSKEFDVEGTTSKLPRDIYAQRHLDAALDTALAELRKLGPSPS
jgi:predicted nucleic acid-binding protein